MRAEEKTSILIVDDDISYRWALAKTFHKAGYAVTLAADGQKALQLLERHSFQLVLTDLKMPEKDGLDLLRALQNHRPRPKVIIMTAYGTRDSYLEAQALGVSSFLLKPLARDYLLWAVKETLDQRDGPPYPEGGWARG